MIVASTVHVGDDRAAFLPALPAALPLFPGCSDDDASVRGLPDRPAAP